MNTILPRTSSARAAFNASIVAYSTTSASIGLLPVPELAPSAASVSLCGNGARISALSARRTHTGYVTGSVQTLS